MAIGIAMCININLINISKSIAYYDMAIYNSIHTVLTLAQVCSLIYWYKLVRVIKVLKKPVERSLV